MSAFPMIGGLAVGLFLCFFAHYAGRFLLSLRSVLSGAVVLTFLLLAFLERGRFIQWFSTGTVPFDLTTIFVDRTHPLRSTFLLGGFSAGGILLFLLSRHQGKGIERLLGFLTGLSMGIMATVFLTSRLHHPFGLIASIILLVPILGSCLKAFDWYFAIETACVGALLLSTLVTDFWYLEQWTSLMLFILLALCGTLAQLASLRRHERKEKEATNA